MIIYNRFDGEAEPIPVLETLGALADILGAGAPPGTEFRLYQGVRLSELTGGFPIGWESDPCLRAVLCRNRKVLLTVLSDPRGDCDDDPNDTGAPVPAGLPVLDRSAVLQGCGGGSSPESAAEELYRRLTNGGVRKMRTSSAWQYHPVVIPDSLRLHLRELKLLGETDTITDLGEQRGLRWMRRLGRDPEGTAGRADALCCSPGCWKALWKGSDSLPGWEFIPFEERWQRISTEGITAPAYYYRGIYDLMDMSVGAFMDRPVRLVTPREQRRVVEAYFAEYRERLEEEFGSLENCTFHQAVRRINNMLSDAEKQEEGRQLMRSLCKAMCACYKHMEAGHEES